MTKAMKWVVGGFAALTLMIGVAAGVAVADADAGPSTHFNGGGPDVRGGNHPSTTTTTTTTTTTVSEAISDETVEMIGTTICDTFDTAYLNEIVPVMVETPGLERPLLDAEALVLIGMSMHLYCPYSVDAFWMELDEQYPQVADWVRNEMEG